MATYIFRFPVDFAQEFDDDVTEDEIFESLWNEALEEIAWHGRVEKFEEEDA